jgi:hypothetical protein
MQMPEPGSIHEKKISVGSNQISGGDVIHIPFSVVYLPKFMWA